MYAVGFEIENRVVYVEDVQDFDTAKEFAEKNNGYVYAQDPEFGIADRIWPKPYVGVSWQEINDMLVHTFC